MVPRTSHIFPAAPLAPVEHRVNILEPVALLFPPASSAHRSEVPSHDEYVKREVKPRETGNSVPEAENHYVGDMKRNLSCKIRLMIK